MSRRKPAHSCDLDLVYLLRSKGSVGAAAGAGAGLGVGAIASAGALLDEGCVGVGDNGRADFLPPALPGTWLRGFGSVADGFDAEAPVGVTEAEPETTIDSLGSGVAASGAGGGSLAGAGAGDVDDAVERLGFA